jgi:predicted Holliday junction resolvase-like endonuclease
MKPDILEFFQLSRQIFGICPECGEFFRLSECRIFLKKRPRKDWLDGIVEETEQLERAEKRLEEEKEKLQENAREKGRKQAQKIIKKMDPIFAPRKLHPEDAKVVFHPIDYIVFNGMHRASIKNILLLDRQPRSPDHRSLQKSLERVIEKGHYEWLTLRVREDGSIQEE